MTAPFGIATRPYDRIDITLEGSWGDAPPGEVLAVIHAVRDCCLAGVEARDAEAPRRITVVGIPNHPYPQCPAIGLAERTALMILCVDGSYWSQLAYQFGHELGHVVANNWGASGCTLPPSHWLEEALVQAFGLSGMLKLSRRWSSDPPLAGRAGYAASLEHYARTSIQEHVTGVAGRAFDADPGRWLDDNLANLEPLVVLDKEAVGPLVARLVLEFEAGPGGASDLAALNLWPERSALPLGHYLDAWEASCVVTGRPGRLPARIRTLLGVRS